MDGVRAALVGVSAAGQSSGSTVAADLKSALRGDWVGVLEYRDYSEPPTSTKRVDLPTWLSVTSDGEGKQTWHYVYDDGPNKTVDEIEAVTFDPAREQYTAVDNGKPAQTFHVAGYSALKGGRGTLTLTGSGTDSGKPAEIREMMTIRRNLLEVLEETRSAGSQDAFAFRHLYRLVRREAPAVTGAK
ncbi:hypothetical protein [Terriglobus aquaticus]|uniref:hypothetical protein n=1 Tax=Terriglobus aquaticus TaxID=940139 RepID=UPI0021E0B80E|nr:hypothetical protein [Terriglobus aquaticus]